MGKLFGRDSTEECAKIDQELQQLENGGTVAECAIAENLRTDDRVSENRAGRFFSQRSKGRSVLDTLQFHACNDAGRVFRKLEFNEGNLVHLQGEKLQHSLPQRYSRLVTIMRLGDAMRGHLSDWLRDVRIANSGDDIGTAKESTLVDQWLAQFEGRSVHEIEELRDGMKEAHRRFLQSRYQGSYRYRPHIESIVWVGCECEFEKHSGAGPLAWLEAFGLGHLLEKPSWNRDRGTADWFLLLKYDMGKTYAAARPSVLDAGPNPWHFPTPARIPCVEGGRAMFAGHTEQSIEPLVEFIHDYRRIERDDIHGVYRFEPSSATKPLNLRVARDNHRARLAKWAGGF